MESFEIHYFINIFYSFTSYMNIKHDGKNVGKKGYISKIKNTDG